MDNETKREIIMEHYMHPLNKNTIEDKSYLKVNTNSETCIDNIDVYVLIKNNIIEDIHFNGEACAISTSAASIMTKLLKGKKVKEVRELIKEYNEMIDTGKTYDNLNEALAYSDIYKQQNRKGCATIPWRGIQKAINEYKSKN